MNSGFFALGCKQAGFSARQLKQAVFDARQRMDSGSFALGCKQAGFSGDASFAERPVDFAAVEDVLCSGPLCGIYWLQKRG